MIWLHKNESNSHGFSDEDRRTYVQPVIPVCIDDSFEISIPLFGFDGSFLKYLDRYQYQIRFEASRLIERPPVFSPFEKTEYEKPNMELILSNKLAKTLKFYK